MHKHLYLFVCLFFYSSFTHSAQEKPAPTTNKTPHYFTFSPEHIALSKKNAAKKRAHKKRIKHHKKTAQPLPPEQVDLYLPHIKQSLNIDDSRLPDQLNVAPPNSPTIALEKTNYCLLAQKTIALIVNYYP